MSHSERNETAGKESNISRLLALVRPAKRGVSDSWMKEELLDLAYEDSHVNGEVLFDYWEGTLDDAARESVHDHVSSCELCFPKYAEIGRLVLKRAHAEEVKLPEIPEGLESFEVSFLRKLHVRILELLESPTLVPAAADKDAIEWRVKGPIASKVRPGFSFRWECISDAEIYDLMLYRADDPSTPLVEKRIEVGLDSERDVHGEDVSVETQGDTELNSALAPGGKYVWQVRALDTYRKIVGLSGRLSFEVLKEEGPETATGSALEPIDLAMVLASHSLLDDSIELLEAEKGKPTRKLAALAAVSILEKAVENPKLAPDDKAELDKALENWRSLME